MIPGLILLFSFFSIHLCLIYYFYPKFIEKLSLENKKIIIIDTPKTKMDKFNFYIEYIVLCRYSFCGYKNYVRSNLRILSAISLTTLTCLSIYLVCLLTGTSPSILKLTNGLSTLELSGIVAIVGMCISTFILERSHLHKKWEFLAGLNSKILEVQPSLKRQIMEINLALHLIEMEMWSHNTFVDLFNSVFINALTDYKQTERFKIKPIRLIRLSSSARFTKTEAYDIVKKYKDNLIERQTSAEKIDKLLA